MVIKYITDNGGELVSGVSKSIMKDSTEETTKQKFVIMQNV